MKTPIKAEKKICKGFRRSEGHKGEPCKMRAVEGSDYCKYHGGGAVGKKTGKGRPKGTPKPKGAGGSPPKSNLNARKHGAFSARLLPEEQERYERIKEEFTKDLGDPERLTAADRRVVHQLAVVSTKFDVALENGAPPDALESLQRMIHREMKALQVTRESKDSSMLTGNSPAEVVAALFMKAQRLGIEDGTRALPEPDVIDVDVVEVKSESVKDGEK